MKVTNALTQPVTSSNRSCQEVMLDIASSETEK